MKTIREIMRPSFLFRIHQTSPVSEAVHAMTAYNIGIVIVVDDEDKIAGVFSERDVVQRVLARGLNPARTLVGDVMTTELVVGDVNEDYRLAMLKMDRANIRHLPVVNGEQIVSMLSIRDLMRVGLAEADVELEYLRAYLYQVLPSTSSQGAH